MGVDLESLREILKDNRQHVAIGMITKLDLADDRSNLKCLVKIFPEQQEYVARMTWELVGAGSGLFQFPQIRDLVLVAFADGDEDQCFIIKRLTSKEDKIPVQVTGGDTALIANGGKRAWLVSDSKIFLAKGSTAPLQPIPLGTVLKTLLSDIIGKLSELTQKISIHTHLGNLGYPTDVPLTQDEFVTIKTFFDNKKASPVDDNAINSDLAFTEKGS